MDLNLISWNGNNINDLKDFNAYILPEEKFKFNSQPQTAPRAENFPQLSGAVLPPHTFTFQITILSEDLKTQDLLRDKLRSWFSPLDFQKHALIAEDKNDGNKKHYQLVGLPASGIMDTGEGKGQVTFLITLAVDEPLWQAVDVTSTTWLVTGTGQTKVINNPGNEFTRPKITITPTTARTGQFAYHRWCQIYNRAAAPLVNRALDITDGGLNTANLVNDTTVSNQINVGGGINASVTTIPIDTAVGGGLPAQGFGYVGTEQISWTGNTGTSLTGVTRGIGGTTAASHADNAVIARSKMLADGSDIAVQVDGAFVNRWVDGANGATTKIWIGHNGGVGYAGTLRTALLNNSSDVTVQFTIDTTTNRNLLLALKRARNTVFIIGSEAFTYSPANIDLAKMQITSCKRAQKNTSAAAHSALAAITWIEHDIWLLYGNSSGSTFVTDDNFKPLRNLNTSTNTSIVLSNFFDTSSSNRPDAWQGAVIQTQGKQSQIYTGNQTALANPSTELGMSLINYVQANIWKAETAQLAWSFYDPVGITTVSMSGSKRLISGTGWPTVAGLQKSNNGTAWLTVWTEAIPALNTWVTFTHNAQSLSGTYTNIRLALLGAIAAGASNEADLQGDTITLALDSTKTPSVTLGSENSTYYLNLQITNNTTGDYIILKYNIAINQTITIDTIKKVVTAPDGSNIINALTTSATRNDWIPLNDGNNTLEVDDVGIANLSIVVQFYPRNW